MDWSSADDQAYGLTETYGPMSAHIHSPSPSEEVGSALRVGGEVGGRGGITVLV